MPLNPRSGRPRLRITRAMRQTQGICWLCGAPIDPTLHHNDRMAWTCDEIIPLADGGSALDPMNLRAAHRACNSRRGKANPPVKNSRQW